ncbi:MAG TPA: sulfatase-like hydrolase/transferase [Terriglobales bacterium]|nr:sulfatase-like hydrolase/transferase [Terriglobales bacterium]
MAKQLNVLLVVIDSLRAKSLEKGEGRPATPFLDALNSQSIAFTRAYASECWTLPSHMSMFTGLLPSQHQAHFQAMSYQKQDPTIAEHLAAHGYRTEIISRNHVFDGTIPGVTRGFQFNTRPLSTLSPLHPLGLFLAATKPRSRRLMRETGFFIHFI